MNSEQKFSDRLLMLIGDAKPYSWAAKHGMARASMFNVLNNNGLPSANQLIKISESTGVSTDWLLTGKGPKYKNEKTASPAQAPGNFDIPENVKKYECGDPWYIHSDLFKLLPDSDKYLKTINSAIEIGNITAITSTLRQLADKLDDISAQSPNRKAERPDAENSDHDEPHK